MKRFVGIRKDHKTFIPKYKQIFCLFFTFFLVFVLISIVTYTAMVAKQKQRLKEQVGQSLSVDVNLMNQYIKRVHNATYKFLSRTSVYSDIPPAEGEYTPADYRNILTLVEQMEEFYSSVSDYALHVYFFSNDRHVITPVGTYEFDAYFDWIFKHDYYTADFWRNTHPESARFSSYPVDTVRNDATLSVSQLLPVVASWEKQEQRMTLVTEINSSYVKKMMVENLTLEGQSVLCVDPWGNTLVNTLAGPVLSDELRKLNSRVAQTDTPVQLELITLDGEAFSACGMRDINGMTYYILTPVSVLSRAAYQTNRYLLIIFLGTMVMFFFLTLFFSNKLFHPIQEILSSLERLKKDNTVAVQNWHQAESSLREQRAISDEYVNSYITLVRSSVMLVETGQMEPYFYQATGLAKEELSCMVLELYFQNSYATEFDENQRKVINEALPQVLQALFNNHGYLTRYDENAFVCFFNGGEATREKLWDALGTLRGILQFDYRYCHILCGISEVVTRKEGSFSAVVSQAFAAISRGYLSRTEENFSVVDFENDRIQYRPVLVQNDISRIYNLMRTGEKEELYIALDEILQTNTAQNVHYDTMKLIIIRLYSVAADYLLACNLDPKVTAEGYWDRVLLENCAKNPQDALKNFLGHCLDITRTETSDDENISLVLSYITTHYNEMLYLDLIAQRVNMNPKYLSRFFKNKVGISIIEYINLVRIGKAKDMLVKTDMKIEEIGTAAGFENRTTFFRLFKKLEGMPPNRYRKDHIQ